MTDSRNPPHPLVSRRTAVQASVLGLLGLGMNHLAALRAATLGQQAPGGTARSCIYIFLSGGTVPSGPDRQPRAADFLFRSNDLVSWEYLHPFVEADRFTRVGDERACPYSWPIGDRHILLFSSHMS
jgi:hypothetical protein